MAASSNGECTDTDECAARMTAVVDEEILEGNGLPRALLDIARQDIGETDVMRQESLKKLGELIAGHHSLPCGMDEEFLTVFLRARKYDAMSAFTRVKSVSKAQRDNPETFKDLGVHSVPFDTACRKHQIWTVSRGTDTQGRPAAMLRLGKWSNDICSINDLFRLGALHVLHLLRKEESQLRGIVAVVDAMGLGPHHLIHITPSVIRKCIMLVQDCCPLRIKGIYVVNQPAIFNALFAVAKRFLKPKLVKRLHFLGYDVSKLHRLVPKDLIPEEFGGTHESYDYDEMERELESQQEWFRDFLRASRSKDKRRLKANRRGSNFGVL